MHNDYISMLKDKEKTKKEVDDKRQQLIINMRGAESSKGVGLDSTRLNILTPPKTSSHSANLAISENTSTIVALRSTSQSTTEDKPEHKYFIPIQDEMKKMDEFFSSTIAKLTADFNSESPTVLRAESTDTDTDSHTIMRLKKKLKTIKESYSFVKETGNKERAKSKMESIESIEDQLESYYDNA